MEESTKRRFLSKVRELKPADCWEWTGALNLSGYGSFWLGKCVLAHRLAYKLANGDIPEGMMVMHSCDNRKCCNPNHLFIGTAQDNMTDMVNKGRSSRMPGERHPMKKLNDQDVLRIRMLADHGWRQVDIASAFNLHQTNVSLIVARKTWSHI